MSDQPAGTPAMNNAWDLDRLRREQAELYRLASAGAGVLLPVAHGALVTLVDADVAPRFQGASLWLTSGYVRLWQGGPCYLHRLVLDAPPGRDVHHVNTVRQDNRRENLRLLSRPEHLTLEPPRRSARPRGVEVSHRGPLASFGGRLRAGGRRYAVSGFREALLAGLAYDDLARALARPDEALNYAAPITEAQLWRRLHQGPAADVEVFFVRRDGTLRRLRGQVVPPAIAARAPAGTRRRRAALVLDVERGEYRTIPVRNCLCLTCNGTSYRVVRPRRGTPCRTCSET